VTFIPTTLPYRTVSCSSRFMSFPLPHSPGKVTPSQLSHDLLFHRTHPDSLRLHVAGMHWGVFVAGTRPVTSPHHHLIITAAVSNPRSPGHCLDLCPYLRNGLCQPFHKSSMQGPYHDGVRDRKVKRVRTSLPTSAPVIGMNNGHGIGCTHTPQRLDSWLCSSH